MIIIVFYNLFQLLIKFHFSDLPPTQARIFLLRTANSMYVKKGFIQSTVQIYHLLNSYKAAADPGDARLDIPSSMHNATIFIIPGLQ